MSKYDKNQPETIQAMFGSIASNYDKTNAALSLQMHRLWNRKLIDHTFTSGDTRTIADLCCGTGEIAFNWLKSANIKKKAYLVDFCEEMLHCAKHKAQTLKLDKKHHISYVQADVQKLPLRNASIDCATIAYGIRNVQDPSRCFKEVLRVLKPGGKFGILELTEPENSFLYFGHRIYLRTILPIMGKLLTSNKEAYQYLCNSIHNFVKAPDLAHQLEHIGFHDIEIHPLTGGIATIILARK